MDTIMEQNESEKQADVVEVEPEAVEVVAEETPVEVKAEEPVEEKTTVEAPVEEPKAEVILPVETPTEPEKTVTLAECETRVKGMQSKMGKQLDSLRKEYDAKILDFTNQLKLKDDELMEAKASITSITSELEKAKRELQETASALEQKTSALAKLNASVLSPSVSDGDGWKKLKGKAFFEWLKNHPEVR